MVNVQAGATIIDTDGGVDDAIALVMALNCDREALEGRHRLALEAITVVAGNVDVHQAAHNVLRTIDIVDPKLRPLVAKGCDKPLMRSPFNAVGIHGSDGLGELHRFKNSDGSLRYPPISAEPSSEDAVEVLLKGARDYGDELIIVALGPLTNLATALERDRATLQKVGRIYIMGGAIKVPGNISAAAEFNFFVDPHAAQMVMESGIPLTLVGLDVTMKVPLFRRGVEDLARKFPSPVTQFVADCTEIYMAFHRDNEGFHGCYLHDPLAVGAAMAPSLVATQPLWVVVETEGRFTSGMSLADLRDRSNESAFPPNVDVALSVDADRFFKLFYQLVQLPSNEK
ncbi:MAG: nucleoside hydrolase [Cyanobacteriota bacterium]|nr:nucleoside hydrolase [Cyanobacteriota bacterium]